MYKKTLTVLAVTVLSASTFISSSFAQNKTRLVPQKNQNHRQTNSQQKSIPTQHFQNGLSQRHWIDPGYRPPAPKLGLTGQMVQGFGMKVLSVGWGSAARTAGLETGDVITQINGRMIRSQWDYDQALMDAARFYQGRVNMMVRNVRFDWGHHVPEYVMASTVLDGFGVPAGPMGPQSIGPQIAARRG